MSVPTFPLIIAADGYSVQIISDTAVLKGNVRGVLTNDVSCVHYDTAGVKWSRVVTSLRVKENWVNRFLARTIYNPDVPVEVNWIPLGEYPIQELVDAIHDQVDKDDDMLTQFVEAEVIKTEVSTSKSVQEIVGVLNKYVFEVDEESLWKEQEARDGSGEKA